MFNIGFLIGVPFAERSRGMDWCQRVYSGFSSSNPVDGPSGR